MLIKCVGISIAANSGNRKTRKDFLKSYYFWILYIRSTFAFVSEGL